MGLPIVKQFRSNQLQGKKCGPKDVICANETAISAGSTKMCKAEGTTVPSGHHSFLIKGALC
eukprot:860731-Pleurochrysis_carterae.AAC.1